ncbi:MAG: hypothetical protein IIB18_05675 [Chloroflexi bacterium]|nr:hypothetical protein [Chloroflexota bacterium]
MGRTPADKGGTVFSVADRNSAAWKFALLLLKDDELKRTVIDARHRYARAIKALDRRLQGKASPGLLHHFVEAQNPASFGGSMKPLDWERVDRSWRLGIKYEVEISNALEALSVRAGWLPGFLLIPPRRFGRSEWGPFFKPAQVPAERRDVADFVDLVLGSSLPELNSLLDQPPDAGIVSLKITYDPAEDKREDIEGSARLRIGWQLDQIDERYQAHHGLSSRPRRRPRLGAHVRWLYQRLVEQQTWSEIVEGERLIESEPVNDESTVRDAVRKLAEALKVELPPRKPGPRPKHGTKHEG